MGGFLGMLLTPYTSFGSLSHLSQMSILQPLGLGVLSLVAATSTYLEAKIRLRDQWDE